MSPTGSRGPIPEQRANILGHRSHEFKEAGDLTKIEVGPKKYEIKPAPEDWHEIAKMVYNAAVESPVAQSLYLSTDWAMLYSLCDDLSAYKAHPKGRSSMMATAVYSAMSNLLLTEGERRRVKVETIAPQKKSDPDAEAMAAYAGLDD